MLKNQKDVLLNMGRYFAHITGLVQKLSSNPLVVNSEYLGLFEDLSELMPHFYTSHFPGVAKQFLMKLYQFDLLLLKH